MSGADNIERPIKYTTQKLKVKLSSPLQKLINLLIFFFTIN